MRKADSSITWFNPKEGVPTITIAEYGLNLNRSASAFFQGAKRVRVGYNTESKLLAITPTSEVDRRGLAFKTRFGYTRICCKPFIRYIVDEFSTITSHTSQKRKKYFAEWDDYEKMLIANLNKPIA